jgi:hypothetical protein
MLLILLILALTVIVLLELPGLIKNQLYREIWVFSFLSLAGTGAELFRDSQPADYGKNQRNQNAASQRPRDRDPGGWKTAR